jgi:hypothetical protein
MARLPEAVARQVKAYAAQHGQSISGLIREGLEWRLTAGDMVSDINTAFVSDNKPALGSDTNTDTPNIVSDRKAGLGRRPATDATVEGSNILSDTKSTIASDRKRSILSDTKDILSDTNGAPAAFDPAKFKLGQLCKHQGLAHAWPGTTQTLYRRGNGMCRACEIEKKRAKRRPA